MADRTTRDALLRLRRVTELEAQRVLAEARAAWVRSCELAERADARAAAAEQKLAAARAAPPPTTAGRLAVRDRFIDRLRATSGEARRRSAVAAREAVAAESALHQAQSGMESALRSREAAQSQSAALAVRAQRQRARREESANDDRWRAKK